MSVDNIRPFKRVLLGLTPRLSVCICAAILVACGGGGSGGGGSSTRAPELDLAQLGLFDAESVKASVEERLERAYTGSLLPAEATIEEVHFVSQAELLRNRLFLPNLTIELDQFFSEVELSDDNENSQAIQIVLPCGYGGSVEFNGSLDSLGSGSLNLLLNDCTPLLGKDWQQIPTAFNGKGLLHIENFENKKATSVFTRITASNERYVDLVVSGYLELVGAEDYLEYHGVGVMQGSSGSGSLYFDLNYKVVTANTNTALKGRVYLGKPGYFDVVTSENTNPDYDHQPGKIEFFGSHGSSGSIEYYDDRLIKILIDQDGDQQHEHGIYVQFLDTFLREDRKSLKPIRIDELNYPPTVSPPAFLTTEVDTTEAIEVELGSFTDDDTPPSALNADIVWEVNGNPVPNQNSTTLPPGIAKKGDIVAAYSRVSDPYTVSLSEPVELLISNAPSTLVINDAPDQVISGEQLSFKALEVDPDENQDIAPTLLYGPSGAKIDSTGKVTWTPGKMLFEQSLVHFGFKSTSGETDDIKRVEVKVVSPDTAPPLVRGPITGPTSGSALFIGNFVGDSDKEILYLNRLGTISVVENRGAQPKMALSYPYGFSYPGRIRQLIPIDVDNDGIEEIYAANFHDVYLIEHFDRPAKHIIQSQENITDLTIIDADDDGEVEIYYLSSSEDGATYDLYVKEGNDGQSKLLRTGLIASNITPIIRYGNTDADSDIELVTSNGYVINAITGDIEWYFGQNFGDRRFTLADVNGDGADDILTGSGTVMQAYSVVTKTAIDMENAPSRTCDRFHPRTDDHVFVTDDCDSSFVAYHIKNSYVEEVWRLPYEHIISTRNFAIGDSDNDGVAELHWGRLHRHANNSSLVVYEAPPMAALSWEAKNNHELYAAGFANLPNNQTLPMVFSTSDDPSELFTLTNTDNFETINNFPVPNEHIRDALLADFNGDGISELAAVGRNYLFSYNLLVEDTFFSLLDRNSSPFYSYLRLIYLQNDNSPKLLNATNQEVEFIDALSGGVEITIPFSSSLNDFIVSDSSDSSKDVLLLARNDNQLEKWGISDYSSTLIESQDVNCQRVIEINVDADNSKEIICLGRKNSANKTPLIIFNDGDNGLQRVSDSYIPGQVTEVATYTDHNGKERLIASLARYVDRYSLDIESSVLAEIDPFTGSVIWESLPLTSQLNPRHFFEHSIPEKRRILFSTAREVFLIEQ